MKFKLSLSFALVGLALGAVAPVPFAALARSPVSNGSAARNWIATVAPTNSGSYVIGNPAAPARLVEYLSYTCTHCAQFVSESGPLKSDYVKTGKASMEIRHALRDPLDLAAALLARCEGPAKFLGHSDAIFAAQPDWLAKGSDFAGANQKKLQGAPISTALVEYARGSGLTALMEKRGLAPARINACLTNADAQGKLAKMADEAWRERKIKGTPSIMLNGAIAENVRSWAELKPRLDAALKP